METRKYGIVLRSVQERDLEQVRQWRNARHVRQAMEYRETISPQMQQQWFAGLDKARNLYFMISQGGKEAGVVNLKDIDRETTEAEAGIFIGEERFLGSLLPVIATIVIMEIAFEEQGLLRLKAKIGAENERAVRFNQSMGYEKMPGQEGLPFQYYTADAASFYQATQDMRRMLAKFDQKP